jgi:hypothetical protein
MVDFERTGLTPEEQHRINNEGFEGDAAVLIGKKEDMKKLKEKLESEEKATDLPAYIKMHKEIILPKEGMEPNTKNRVIVGAYDLNLAFQKGSCTNFEIMFIDKDGNLARVKINPDSIGSLKDSESESFFVGQTRREMQEAGFVETFGRWNEWDEAVRGYRDRMKYKRAGKAQEEFDF